MKLVILDRDGVINHDSEDYIKSPDEWVAIDGSLDAIAMLNSAGYKVVVATNQSGVGRGYFNIETLNQIHQKMQNELKDHGGHIDAIFFCPHKPEDNCDCRKPKPGLLIDIGDRLLISLKGVPVIGDSERDLKSASEVGAQPILVKTGKGMRTLETCNIDSSIPVFDNLQACVKSLLEKSC